LPFSISDWLTHNRLVYFFWIAAALALAAMAYSGAVGWDSQDYWKTIEDLRLGVDPYAKGIAEVRIFQSHYLAGQPEHLPTVYHYPPLTLLFLRWFVRVPGWMLAVGYAGLVGLGTVLQLYCGFQMADKKERRWLAFLLPAVIFFPGLVTDDVILSGNVAYILYGIVLAAAVPGWKHGKWTWYYVAVLVASAWKLPSLTLLAFPVLVDRRQWWLGCATAAAGVSLFLVQMRLWPGVFQEYLLAIRMMFDWKREYGFSPGGYLGRTLVGHGMRGATASNIVYLVFACALGIVLLMLAHRVALGVISREAWIPVAMLGTLLLNPRIMKYDIAAFTVPMLLIGWRVLGNTARSSRRSSRIAKVALASAWFLAANVITIIGPNWMPVELITLLALFTMGAWSLVRNESPVREFDTLRELGAESHG
jgi:hypothetical protein